MDRSASGTLSEDPSTIIPVYALGDNNNFNEKPQESGFGMLLVAIPISNNEWLPNGMIL